MYKIKILNVVMILVLLFTGTFYGWPIETAEALSSTLVQTGTYTGTGVDDRSITGIGFQPDFVIIKGNNSTYGAIRTSTMVGDKSKSTNLNTALEADSIQSLDSDGFTLGTSAYVNANAITYYWIAMKASSNMVVGTYSGNSGTQSIAGVGFQPEYIMILQDDTESAYQRSSTMSGSVALGAGDFDTAPLSRITGFDAGGFSLGNSDKVNQSGVTYHYIAWNEVTGLSKAGTYLGDGGSGQNITGFGFQPEFINLRPNNLNRGHLQFASHDTGANNETSCYSSDTDNPNVIVDLLADGMAIGSSSSYANASGITYHYVAWKERLQPTYEQSAYRIFANADSADVGAALAAENTGASLSGVGDAFRARMLVHIGNDQLYQSDENFKLQFAPKGAGCSSASYSDVTGATVIAYKNNASPSDGATLTDNANDPLHSGHTIVNQTYEESNNFTNSVAAIPSGQDGLFDFALYDNGATASTTYCLKMVLSGGTALNTYTQYPEITTASGNDAPTATQPTSIFQNSIVTVEAAEPVDVSGRITFQTTISDADSDNTKLKFEYSDNGGSTWKDPDIAVVTPSSGSVSLDDTQTYQLGVTDAIDTSGGAVTLTIIWDTKSALNNGGSTSLDNTEQSDIQVRVTPNDGTVDGTAQASASFSLDNTDPSGLTAATVNSHTVSSAVIGWTAVTETNFDHYEVWYGTSQADVQNRTGTATEWDNDNDAALATKKTTSTTITGLSANTGYYFKVWAKDDYGAQETVSDILAYTTANTPGAPTVTSSSTSTLTVIISPNSNPDTTEYAIKIGDNYVQTDGTLGPNAVWQTHANWGGATGQTVTGLSSNTQYSVQVKARNGDTDETSLSSAGSATTQTPPTTQTELNTGGGNTGGGGGGGGGNDRDEDRNTDDTLTGENVAADLTAAEPAGDDLVVTVDEVREILDGATNSAIDGIAGMLEDDDSDNISDTTGDAIDAAIIDYEDSGEIEGSTSLADTDSGERYDLISVEDEEADTVADIVGGGDTDATATDEGSAANTIREGIEESIDRTIADTGGAIEAYINLGGGRRSKIKIENKDKVAIILGIRKNKKDVEKEIENAEKAGKIVLLVDENTNLDNDEISDVYQIQHDIPLFNTDPDKDGVSTLDEIYMGLNPVIPDAILEIPRITNIGRMRTGSRPSIRLSGRPGDTVNVYLIAKKDVKKSKKHIGRTMIDETHKGEITVGFDLEEGEYYAVPESEDGIGEVVEFIVDSGINLNTPKVGLREVGPSVKNIIMIVSRIVPYLNLERFLVQLEEEVKEGRRVFIGYTDPSRIVHVTWKSIILSSVVISDASQGRFEIAVPDNLPEGDHEVITYVMNEKNRMISSRNRLIFRK